MKVETRADVGLVAPLSRPRLPGPLKGMTGHYNGPAMGLQDVDHSVCQARWRGIQRFHMGRNHPNPHPNGRHWQDIAYTCAVCFHAIVMEGRGKDVRTAANGTKKANDEWYAFFFMLGGDEEPTLEMLEVARQFADIRLGVTVWSRHSDHRNTPCPGKVGDYIHSGQLLVPDSPSRPPSKPEPERTWTEELVKNLPLRRRRSDLNNSNQWDRRIQGLLVAAGVLPLQPNLEPGTQRLDGKFGPSTEHSVRTFQQRNGIGVDGIVGEDTWTKLLGR